MRVALAATLGLAGLTATPAAADVTATAVRTDDPSTVALTVRLDIVAKRPLVRRVFAESCWEPNGLLACIDSPTARKVRLHKGRNRRTVTLTSQAVWYGLEPILAGWDGNPATYPDGLVPAVRADATFFWFGTHGVHEVTAAPVARETLSQGGLTP